MTPTERQAMSREFAQRSDQATRYSAKVNVITKVLDFIQFGGLECTVGGTIFEMWLGAL